METFLICYITGILFYGIFCLNRYSSYQNQLSPIDAWRKKCKDNFLVLHIPSYRDGVESYVPKQYENFNLSKDFLSVIAERF